MEDLMKAIAEEVKQVYTSNPGGGRLASPGRVAGVARWRRCKDADDAHG